MCPHLVSASISRSQPETLIPQMMGQHSKLSSTTTGCRGCKLYKHWLLSTRRTHTWRHPSTAAAAASSMCYFANCNPGQDNKMASRHFVNISVLARSAPGRLLTDRCVDWISFFSQELCPGLPDCKRASRGKCTGRREGLTNAKQFIKIRHKASIRGEGCC